MAWVNSADEVIAAIELAFQAAPRPPDEALLHPSCFDDNDLRELRPYAHWSEVPDDVVREAYAAPALLSPAGFRHFLPAYLIHALRHPDDGDPATESILMSLSDEVDGSFVPSKFGELTSDECGAVVAFLEAMSARVDVDALLVQWWDRCAGRGA